MNVGDKMVEKNGQRKAMHINISEQRLSVIVFSLFFSWLLAIPFEGRILYELADLYGISAYSFVLSTIIAHFVGLLTCGFFVKSIRIAKWLILFSIVFCTIASVAFYYPPSTLWNLALILSAFLVGCCVSAWGFYLKSYTQKNERINTIADGLIYSNILMILLNLTAIYISPRVGLGFSILVLVIAFLFALLLPKKEMADDSQPFGQGKLYISKADPMAFLCLFIVVITINSGLMYQVQGPAFANIEWLTSWYWAIPYIAALFIMRNLPKKTNRTYILYVAIAMIGFSFIVFMVLDHSWMSYLVVNTLMMGACGVYDLFWWSILGEMLELNKNPARIIGIGLSANVLGVLLGGFIGNAITNKNGESQNPTLLALGVVCITLVLLPPLHKRLTTLLKDHVYLTTITDMPAKEQPRLICEFNIKGKLTERESEIAALLIKGKTYRMIAGELHVSENTIKTHVKSIYSKSEVKSRTELMNLLLDIHTPSKESDNI